MTYTVENDRLYRDGAEVPFKRSPNQSGRISPTLIVVHETAGTSGAGSVHWLTQRRAKVSAHLLIDRDGSITQMVEFDRRAWHAGRSNWCGRKDCNSYSIGIELAGPGLLKAWGANPVNARHWSGKRYPIAANDLQYIQTPEHGKGWWMRFTPAQVDALTAVCRVLAENYPIEDIRGHFEVSPGRKVDPNPTLDLDTLRVRALLPPDPADVEDLNLAVGARGGEVLDLQRRLKELGYTQVGYIDGIFGPMTRNAVLAWQAEQGLKPDGIIDDNEWLLLTCNEAKPAIVGEKTEALQHKRDNAALRIQAVSGTTAATLATETAVDAYTGFSLIDTATLAAGSVWEALSGGLDQAISFTGKLKALGLTIDQRTLWIMVGIVLAVTLWSWARTAVAEPAEDWSALEKDNA